MLGFVVGEYVNGLEQVGFVSASEEICTSGNLILFAGRTRESGSEMVFFGWKISWGLVDLAVVDGSFRPYTATKVMLWAG